eukprot:TRINITY_DN24344_c0_g1_i1.p2 TRINITY_DN24344_c0_g1~~TRINITY_DN24344_c0_g1_i1.p2  ORF type:complete len:338 (+),score=115.04 TRINITY_DN24344_c0_g1_i1:93-1106(+)
MDLKLDCGGFGGEDQGIPDLPAGGYTQDDIDITGVELGAGAGGQVNLVRLAKTGQKLAKKSVKLDDDGKRAEVERELTAFLGCECEQLIRFYGAYYTEEDHSVHLLLEYMDLGSLQDVINASGAVPATVVTHITRQATLGLRYLHHEKKGIHRDLKPGNLLINTKGAVKLTDFGVARAMDDSLASAATFVGTLQYMAPERLQPAGKYNFKADMWSLGLTVIQIATGEHPYSKSSGQGFFGLFQEIKDQPPPTLPENSDFSKAMHQWLEMCLKKDPAERATTTELLDTMWMDEAKVQEEDKGFWEFYQSWLDESHGLIREKKAESAGVDMEEFDKMAS